MPSGPGTYGSKKGRPKKIVSSKKIAGGAKVKGVTNRKKGN